MQGFYFAMQRNKLFCLFLTEEAWSGLRARELGQTPLVLVWLTNMSTSPDLYISVSSVVEIPQHCLHYCTLNLVQSTSTDP